MTAGGQVAVTVEAEAVEVVVAAAVAPVEVVLTAVVVEGSMEALVDLEGADTGMATKQGRRTVWRCWWHQWRP